MISGIRECRKSGECRVAGVRLGFRRLVMIRGEAEVREGVPDFPGRLHRARQEEQAQGKQTRQTRSWHGTTMHRDLGIGKRGGAPVKEVAGPGCWGHLCEVPQEVRMSDSQELVPVSEPTEETSDAKSRFDRLIEQLQQERDELRVRLNLAQKEAKDELDRIDERLDDFKRRARDARGQADDAMGDIEGAANVLWNEITEGFARVRKSFSSKE